MASTDDECIAWVRNPNTLKSRLRSPGMMGLQSHPSPIKLQHMKVQKKFPHSFSLEIPSSETITCSCCREVSIMSIACTLETYVGSLAWNGLVCIKCALNLRLIWETNNRVTKRITKTRYEDPRSLSPPIMEDPDEDWTVPDIFEYDGGEGWFAWETSIEVVGDLLDFSYEAIREAIAKETRETALATSNARMLNYDHLIMQSRATIPCSPNSRLLPDVLKMIAAFAVYDEPPLVEEYKVPLAEVHESYCTGYDYCDYDYYDDESPRQRPIEAKIQVKTVPGARRKQMLVKEEKDREKAKSRKEKEKMKGKTLKERRGSNTFW